MINCIILTHGDLGQALLSTAEKIIGPSDGIKVLSNERKSLKNLIESLDIIISNWKNSEIIVMVDFSGGSCWHAAQVVKHDKPNIVLISGVNMTMLLSFISRRESFKCPELAAYLKESSLKGTEIIFGGDNRKKT